MSRLPDSKLIRDFLTRRFGIALAVSTGTAVDGPYIDLRPTDLHDNEGFVVRTVIGWRSVVSRLRVGRFAGDLIRELARASSEKRSACAGVARALTEHGATIRMVIGGRTTDALDEKSWPESWPTCELEVERAPIMIDHENPDQIQQVVVTWGGGLLGMLMCLLPVESLPEEEENEILGLPEGAKIRIEVNRYERSRVNRAVCISIHGISCASCGFNFESVYGSIGQDFIHVHHTVPVSRLGGSYVVDPAKDLVPVCPNCHAMLHRREPPLSIDELRKVISSQ